MTGFQRPEQFDAWQLAWELKERVMAFTATEPATRDRKFCDEICEAARSAADKSRLCRRAIGASTGLQLYLKSLPKNFDPRKMNPKREHEPGT